MTRAIIYCRVSTDPQERDGTSLETQEKQALAYARKHQWEVARLVRDTASGFTLRRPGLEAVRAALADVDVLLAYDFDRIAREQTHMAVILNDVLEAGATLCSVRDGPFEDSAIGKFMLNARTFAAEVEREKIAERTMRGKVEWARRGRYIGPAPYGYRKVGGDDPLAPKVLEINPDEAWVVRRIYAWYLDDQLGHRAITSRLQGLGVPTARGARHWSGQMIRFILERPVYAGRGEWNGIAIDAPAIIDEDTWERAGAERARRRPLRLGVQHPRSLLTGILRCSECGGRMQIDRTHVRKHGREYSYRSYICSTWHAGAGCVSNRHDADETEQRVLDDLAVVTTVRPKRRAKDTAGPLRAELATVDRALHTHHEGRARIMSAIEAGDLFGALARDAVAKSEDEHARLEAERQRITADLTAAEQRERELAERPDIVRQLLETDDAGERKAILHRYWRRIVVRPGDPEPTIEE